MPKLSQRLRVWRGEIRRTTGGLTRQDLMKNKNGKIVSRRKSLAATKANNLGHWVRSRGDKFQGKPKAFPKKAKKEDAIDLTESKPKKKKLGSKLTAVSKQLKKEATRAAKKTEKAERPKQKGVPRPKKADVIDLTGLTKSKPKPEPKPVPANEDDFFDMSMF